MNAFAKKLLHSEGIPRSEAISVQEFTRLYDTKLQPVVMSGVIDSWPAREWSLETFAKRWGDKQFDIDRKNWRLAEYIESVLSADEDSPPPYLRNINVRADFRELLPDLIPDIPYCKHNRLESRLMPQKTLKRGEGRYMQLFIGASGRSFPRVHWDAPPFHTWSALLCGRKEWVLFPPSDTKFLYVSANQHDVSEVSNVYDVNLDAYPDLIKTTPYRVIQEPGEVLFLPSWWWHTAKNLQPSITIAWDQLNRTSWAEYSRYMVDIRKDSPVKAALVRSYLSFVGAVLSSSENLGLGNI